MISRRAGRQTPVALSGVCRAADAGSGSCDHRTRALHQDARLPRRAGQRLLADRRRQAPLYYDLQYWPFWAAVEKTGLPFYLHPRNPLPEDCAIYEGHPWLMGPTWAFGQETAVHALRLMGSGLFDAYPKLKIILGHMGEGLPYSMWRVDHRNGWVKAPPKHKAKKKICDYFQRQLLPDHFGNFRTQTLIDSILEIGADRILFSVDWPFENVDHASDWFNSASISENDRLKSADAMPSTCSSSISANPLWPNRASIKPRNKRSPHHEHHLGGTTMTAKQSIFTRN